MKRALFLTIIGIILIAGCVTEDVNENNEEIFCPDYDGNQQECLSHSKCKWIPEENICNSVEAVNEDDNNEDDLGGFIQELEAIEVPDNPSNNLCKQIPLSGHPPYAERYQCLAIVNHDERFCEGIDEEKEKNMCLAHANENSSYCKLVPQESQYVCYQLLSVSTENASFCSDIDYSQHEKEQCYFNFMSNLYAWDKSDEIKTDYCNELGTPDKYTCLALKARDVSLCGDNPSCLTFFEQDISFCDEHPELPCCIKDRAKTGKNVSICELLPQPDRDNCVGSYCTHTELNVTICDTIEDIGERQNRYMELAMNLGNL